MIIQPAATGHICHGLADDLCDLQHSASLLFILTNPQVIGFIKIISGLLTYVKSFDLRPDIINIIIPNKGIVTNAYRS